MSNDRQATAGGALFEYFGLAGKVALVTGGGSGLGRAIAEGLLKAGAARVYIASRKLEKLERVARELSPDGRCLPLEADLSSLDGVRGLAASLQARENSLDILVNNSGIGWSEPFETQSEKGWDKVFQINLKAPFFLTQALLEALSASATPADPARVINIGSLAGEIDNGSGTFPYGLAKGAVHHATRMLALELADRHITVNAIAPGRFESKLTEFVKEDEERYRRETALVPLKRWGADADIIGLAVFLASKSSAYITGSTTLLDGGLSLVHPIKLGVE